MTFTGAMCCVIGMALCVFCSGLYLLHLQNKNRNIQKDNLMEAKMYTANLREVGDLVMLPVPPALLEMLDMDSGTSVIMGVEAGRLVIEPRKLKKYSLHELLSQCDETAPITEEDSAWTSNPAQGRELL